MNEKIWKSIASFVRIDKYPALPCPYCGKEKLVLDTDTVSFKVLPDKYKEMASRHFCDLDLEKKARMNQTGETVKEAFEDNAFVGFLLGIGAIATELNEDMQSIAQTTAFLQCNHCDGAVSAVGLAKVFSAKNRNNPVRTNEVKFEYFTPAVPMMPLSINIPKSIRLELMDAFKHYHFDPPSAASKLRRAIEKFCKDSKAEGTNLHQQISSLKKTLPLEAQYLEALKLVGNEGTHSDGVNEDDLLLAFEVIQYVLEHYDRKKRFQETFEHYEKITEKFNKPKQVVAQPELA
jgi:hypothetical protein